ncbi:choice-of-anchor P family protein [Microlunatus antarcticus]|uniref:Uncharacterized protein n=1 Tax=Microlunatus antarcticus TaxID=53388 RepID=A0A7W5JVT2_9ACTN|nr:choice-of-anchor P family protein [Microlunatus antarcticus]MBB3326951.1 hypothetical protein [Microlunatus antarcticus]
MSHPRRIGAAALAAAAVTLTVALPAQAATFNPSGGSAYATTASVGTLVNLGKTSYVPLCTTKTPDSVSSNTAALDLGGLLGNVGAATTTVSTSETSKAKKAEAVTEVAGTSLLAGIIQADAITSTATVTKDSKGYDTSGSSVFVNLKIAGLPIKASPKKNTTVKVPGVATVELNAQDSSSGSAGYKAGTAAIRVTLLKNNTLGLPTGKIVVGGANASMQKTTHALPYGNAYGTQLNVASIVGSGKTAAVTLPCGGSAGKTRTNSISSVSAPGVLKVGAVKSTGKSTDSSSSTKAATSSSVAKVNLLDGVVTLDAVNASATATRKKGKVETSSSGTKIAGLKINGKKISVDVKENTQIDIAGIGTLYLRKVVKTGVSTTVVGVQLVLNTDTLGLKSGTTLTVGYAKAGVSAS